MSAANDDVGVPVLDELLQLLHVGQLGGASFDLASAGRLTFAGLLYPAVPQTIAGLLYPAVPLTFAGGLDSAVSLTITWVFYPAVSLTVTGVLYHADRREVSF